MKHLNPSLFNLLYIPAKHPDTRYYSEYRAAYQLWLKVWDQTLLELNAPALFSDQFTRQDEIGCIFYGKECVGMVLYRWIDFNLIDFSRDSYFKVWSQSDIAHLVERGPWILLPSYLTVNPDWRKSASGLDTKCLLMDFMNRRLIDSQAFAMASTTRNQKGINTISYQLGATDIRKNVVFHSDDDRVDLVAIYRESATEIGDPYLKTLAREIWSRRLYVSQNIQLPYHQIQLPLANMTDVA